MKRYVFVSFVLVSLFLLAGAGSSWAADFGFYGELGSGSGVYTIDFDPPEVDDDFESTHLGAGFVLDTAAESEPLLNYRLQVGLESWAIDVDEGEDADLTGLVVANDLGFSLSRTNQKMRFWAGPELRLGYYSGDNDAGDDINVLSIQYGPVIGVNVKLSGGKHLIIKGGYLIGGFDGTIETDIDDYQLYGDIAYTYVDVGLLF